MPVWSLSSCGVVKLKASTSDSGSPPSTQNAFAQCCMPPRRAAAHELRRARSSCRRRCRRIRRMMGSRFRQGSSNPDQTAARPSPGDDVLNESRRLFPGASGIAARRLLYLDEARSPPRGALRCRTLAAVARIRMATFDEPHSERRGCDLLADRRSCGRLRAAKGGERFTFMVGSARRASGLASLSRPEWNAMARKGKKKKKKKKKESIPAIYSQCGPSRARSTPRSNSVVRPLSALFYRLRLRVRRARPRPAHRTSSSAVPSLPVRRQSASASSFVIAAPQCHVVAEPGPIAGRVSRARCL